MNRLQNSTNWPNSVCFFISLVVNFHSLLLARSLALFIHFIFCIAEFVTDCVCVVTFTSLSESFICTSLSSCLVNCERLCMLVCSMMHKAALAGTHNSRSDLCAIFTNWTYFIALFAHKHAIIGPHFFIQHKKKQRPENCVNDSKARRRKKTFFFPWATLNVCVNCCNISAGGIGCVAIVLFCHKHACVVRSITFWTLPKIFAVRVFRFKSILLIFMQHAAKLYIATTFYTSLTVFRL